MKSSESSEDYLETILVLSRRLPVVRSVDISREIGYKKSSISTAMNKLREKGYITISDAGYIFLTEEGKALAERVYERHTVFTDFLIALGVSPDVAERDACRMEHVVSEESFTALKEFYGSLNKRRLS
ncbi:MAG: metal-dependent transcriptional regulator [Eubacterium sp.]|nr:metal-dependent transcriptional regulator [Eubacterium sp.]